MNTVPSCSMTINPDKIRDVIGPSGKQINKIIEET
ncbi:KH domain-containing protein, partial [Bacillus sp. HC-TM]